MSGGRDNSTDTQRRDRALVCGLTAVLALHRGRPARSWRLRARRLPGRAARVGGLVPLTLCWRVLGLPPPRPRPAGGQSSTGLPQCPDSR